MADSEALDSTSATDRLVLLALAEYDAAGETPVQALEVLEKCRDHLDDLEGVVGDKLSEGELMRSCRSLQSTGLVEERPADQTSPTGKGRPEFDLAVDPAAVEETVRGDDRFADVSLETA